MWLGEGGNFISVCRLPSPHFGAFDGKVIEGAALILALVTFVCFAGDISDHAAFNKFIHK